MDHRLIKCLVLGLPNATSSQLNLSRLFSSHSCWWLLPRTVPCLVGYDGPAHWKELTDPSEVPRKSLAVWMAFRELRFIMKKIWASRIFNLTSYDHSSSLCYALHWGEQQHWEAALPYQVLVLGTATVCFLCEVIRFLSQLRLISPSAFGVSTLRINRRYPPHYVHLLIWDRAKLAIDLNTIRTWERSGLRHSLCCLCNDLILFPGHLSVVFPKHHFIGVKLGGGVEGCSVCLPQAGWGSRPFLLVVVAAKFQ